MADFDVNTITAAGATLIASATAGNKLVIDGCDATTDVLTKAQAVQVSTRPASPGSNTTDVALAGSTDNHVYAYAEFIRGQSTGGDFHSFYLYGHIENAPSVIRVIAIASATAATHLPESGDVTNRTELQFELTFSATDEVVTVADSSMYATRGEVQVLRERVVTTHAEGSTTTGDNQTIYGEKTFVNDVSFSDGVTFSDDVTVVGDVGCKTVTPIAAGPYTPKIGGPDAAFREGYFGDVYLERIKSRDNTGIALDNSIAPKDSAVNLGATAKPFGAVACVNLRVCEGDNYGTIYFEVLNDIGFVKTTSPIAPEDVGMWLGSPDYPWGTVWAENFRGCIPYPTSTTAEPPVGSIVFIWINVGTLLVSVELMPGQEVQAQGVGDLYYQQISPASFADGSLYRAGSSPWILYTGKYRLLSGAKPTGSNNDIFYALAIRIE